jgi:hypothetical protein
MLSECILDACLDVAHAPRTAQDPYAGTLSRETDYAVTFIRDCQQRLLGCPKLPPANGPAPLRRLDRVLRPVILRETWSDSVAKKRSGESVLRWSQITAAIF